MLEIKNKKIIAIIPARGGSKGIPKKNIMNFCNKPLIAWTIEQALCSKYINEVYVTTDDRKIKEVSQKYGAKVIRRPDELATDTSSSTAALLHAISKIEKYKKIDVVVFLQATSPVRDKEDINEAIEKFFLEKADSLFSATLLESFGAWKKVNNKLYSVTYDYKNRLRRQDREPYYLENGSIYIFRSNIIKKYNNWLGGKITIYLMPYWRSYEIDKLVDVEICKYYMQKLLNEQKGIEINIKDIQLIVYDFDGVMTSNKVITFEDGKEAVIVNRGDGLAISKIKKMGIPQVVISSESNRVVRTRAEKLGIPVLHNIADKKKCLLDYCRKNGYTLAKTIYIGNDINDSEAMQIVGVAICPSDACGTIKKISRYVLNKNGGEGVIREFFELIQRGCRRKGG